MTKRASPPPEDRHVPGIGGPGSTDAGTEGQSALKLHAGISVIATLLTAFVTILFATVLNTPVLAVAFGILTLACATWGTRAVLRFRAGARAQDSHAGGHST